jgi:hypothetical protein
MFVVLALMLATGSPQDIDVAEPMFVNSLNIHADGVAERELRVARRFASCLTIPRFPTAEEYPAKLQKCERKLPRRRGNELENLLLRVRSIVQTYEGSEASLTIAEPIEHSEPSR